MRHLQSFPSYSQPGLWTRPPSPSGRVNLAAREDSSRVELNSTRGAGTVSFRRVETVEFATLLLSTHLPSNSSSDSWNSSTGSSASGSTSDAPARGRVRPGTPTSIRLSRAGWPCSRARRSAQVESSLVEYNSRLVLSGRVESGIVPARPGSIHKPATAFSSSFLRLLLLRPSAMVEGKAALSQERWGTLSPILYDWCVLSGSARTLSPVLTRG